MGFTIDKPGGEAPPEESIPTTKQELVYELGRVRTTEGQKSGKPFEKMAERLLSYAKQENTPPEEVAALVTLAVEGMSKNSPLLVTAFKIVSQRESPLLGGALVIIDKAMLPGNPLAETLAEFWQRRLAQKLTSIHAKSFEAAAAYVNGKDGSPLSIAAAQFLTLHRIEAAVHEKRKKQPISPADQIISKLILTRPHEENADTEKMSAELLGMANEVAPGTTEERTVLTRPMSVDQTQRFVSYAVHGMPMDSALLSEAFALVKRDFASVPTALGNLVAIEKKLKPTNPLYQELIEFWRSSIAEKITETRSINDVVFVYENATQRGTLQALAAEIYRTRIVQ